MPIIFHTMSQLPSYLSCIPIKSAHRPLAVSVLLIGATLTATIPAHACQLPQSYYKHVSCTSNDRYFLAVKDSGAPVALLNSSGQKVADLMRYSQVDATKLRNGVMPVQVSGKVGYVNIRGREVIPPVYDSLENDPHTNGWARQSFNNRIVVKKAGRFGVISTSNQIIVPFSSQYLNIHDFKNGKAQIDTRSGTNWIGTNGLSLPSSNSSSTSASNPPRQRSNRSTATPQDNNSKSNASATLNVAPQTANEVWQLEQRDGKWGYINNEGVPMIRFTFDEAQPFSEGLAGVRISNNWGFIDLSGELVIPFRFSADGVTTQKDTYTTANISSNDTSLSDNYLGKPAFVFTKGKAWIGSLTNGTKLCIDKLGTNVTCDVDVLELDDIKPATVAVTSTPLQESLEQSNTDATSIATIAVVNPSIVNSSNDVNGTNNQAILQDSNPTSNVATTDDIAVNAVESATTIEITNTDTQHIATAKNQNTDSEHSASAEASVIQTTQPNDAATEVVNKNIAESVYKVEQTPTTSQSVNERPLGFIRRSSFPRTVRRTTDTEADIAVTKANDQAIQQPSQATIEAAPIAVVDLPPPESMTVQPTTPLLPPVDTDQSTDTDLIVEESSLEPLQVVEPKVIEKNIDEDAFAPEKVNDNVIQGFGRRSSNFPRSLRSHRQPNAAEDISEKDLSKTQLDSNNLNNVSSSDAEVNDKTLDNTNLNDQDDLINQSDKDIGKNLDDEDRGNDKDVMIMTQVRAAEFKVPDIVMPTAPRSNAEIINTEAGSLAEATISPAKSVDSEYVPSESTSISPPAPRETITRTYKLATGDTIKQSIDK